MKIELKNKSKFQLYIYVNDSLLGLLPLKFLKKYLYLEEIDREELDSLEDLLYRYYREKVFAYLAKSEHCEKECYDYLKKYQLERSLAVKIINFCLDKNFINDERYAELYVRSYIQRGKMPYEIACKLRLKGIAEDIIQQQLDEQYNQTAKSEVVLKHINKAVNKFYYKDKDTRFQKCCVYLMNRGISYSEFSELLKEKLQDID